MDEKDPTSRPQLRAIQYFFVDGTFEFGLGLMCLILAVYFYLENHTTGLISALLDVSLVLVMIGGAWLVNRLVKRIKENITYPRTGYVAYRQERGKERGWRIAAGMLLGGLMGAIGAVLVTSPHPRMNVMPAFTGLLMAVGLALIGFRSSLPRMYLLAGLSTILGIVLAYRGWGDINGIAAFYLAISLVLFTSGGVTLAQYLRRTRSPEQEEPK